MDRYWIQRNKNTDALELNLKAPTGSLKIINDTGTLFEIDYLGNTVYNKSGCLKYGKNSMCFGDSSLDFKGKVMVNGPVMINNKLSFSGKDNIGIEYSDKLKGLNLYTPEEQTINFKTGNNTMSLSSDKLNISGNIVANQGTFGKINIKEFEDLYIKNGVKVKPDINGPMIESHIGTTNRYGIGNYNNSTRIYASALNPDSSIQFGFARGLNNWDDRITINNDNKKNITLKGNVDIVDGSLKIGAYSFEIDQASGNLNLFRKGKLINQF